jgi:hypothetical protein
MQRRKLLVEALDVVSFDTGPSGPAIGTVRAHVAFDDAGAIDQPAADPKYTEEGYPAYTCTGGINCTRPGLCTCPISCDPAGCSQPPGCVVAG